MSSMVHYLGDNKSEVITEVLNRAHASIEEIATALGQTVVSIAFDPRTKEAFAYRMIWDPKTKMPEQYNFREVAVAEEGTIFDLGTPQRRRPGKVAPAKAKTISALETQLPIALAEQNISFEVAQKIVALIDVVHDHKMREVPSNKQTYDIWNARLRYQLEVESDPKSFCFPHRAPGWVREPFDARFTYG